MKADEQSDGRPAKRSHESRVEALFSRSFPLLVAVLFGGWMLSQRHYLLVDDAYISFRYAANFAHGHGLVWNIGTRVEGYTCLLWVLMLSAVSRIGIDLTFPSVILSSAFGLGCIELLQRISRNALPARAWPFHMTAGLLLASSPPFAHGMTSGMEETCFSFWTLLAVHALVLGRSAPRKRTWAGTALAAACLTRPEGAMIAAVLFLTEAIVTPGNLRQRIQPLIASASIVGAVVALQVCFRYWYYGYPLPNTFYAKVIFGRATVERGAAHIAGFMLAGGFVAALGAVVHRRRDGLEAWLLFGRAMSFAYIPYLLFVGGDHPYWYRFYLPVMPLCFLALAHACADVVDSLRTHFCALGEYTWQWLSTLAVCALTAIATAVSLPFSEMHEPILGRIDAPLQHLMESVDQFFGSVPRNSFVAMAAVGHVGYRHLDLHILDTWGLTDEHIAHVDALPTVKFGHDKQDISYVVAMKPDYVYTFVPYFAPPVPGYDICWPSIHVPAAVYRRIAPLDPIDVELGMPTGRKRNIGTVPPCRPPVLSDLDSKDQSPR